MANVAELVVKIIADTKDAQSGVDDVSSKTSKMGGAISKAALPAAAALTLVAGAAIAAGKAAAEDEQAQAILANTMKKTTGANSAQVAAMEDYISKMTLATGVADDELRPAMGALLRATGDTATSQEALTAALDISASTGKSVETVSAALAKAYGGQTTGLKKLVPSLDDATLASGDMDAIMKALADTTGGAMAASTDTAAGQMKVFKNAMGEAQEEAGSALLPIMGKLADVMVVVAKWIGKNTTLFVIIAAVIATVSAAIIALNIALKVVTITTQVMALTAKVAWLSALGPIALVIVAVLAVVAVVVILWHKSETFRDIVLGVWGAIRSATTNTAGAIHSAWVNSIDAVVGTFRNARDIINGIIGGIREAWAGMVAAIRGAMSGLAAILRAPFDAVKAAIDAVISAVQTLISWLGKIKVPSINLPHIPGVNAVAVPGVGQFAAPGVPTTRAISGGSTGRAINITVNGAVDPEATARQIRRILDGHTRRVGLVT